MVSASRHVVNTDNKGEKTITTLPTSLAKTFAHRFALVNGLRLHYVIGGEGNPIVLLAGFPETWYAWRLVMPTLAQHYTVIAADLPGQGDSDKPESGYDTSTLAENIHGLVAKLGFKRIFLAAHDVGAWVAYPYAVHYPDEVRRLVLLDASIPGVTGVTLKDGIPLSPESWKSWHFLFHQIPDLPEFLITGREREYLSWFLRRKTACPTAFCEADIDEYVRHYSALGGLRAGLAYYRALFKDIAQNQEYAKTKLQMPVLALGGSQGSAPHILQEMQALAQNVRGGVVSDCGHYIPEERPDYLAEQILSFLAEEKP